MQYKYYQIIKEKTLIALLFTVDQLVLHVQCISLYM